ncbi:MAG: hypothetical protein RBU37_11415 [Myxococcota bacterium]|jgi:hypothetical protein|nr:hypothetical protein [Myxococcota bacterium]
MSIRRELEPESGGPPAVLGIVVPHDQNAFPGVSEGLHRFSSWAAFQRHLGELEQNNTLVGHAAANAFINGVQRVVVAIGAVDACASQLLQEPQLALLIAPHCRAPQHWRSLVSAAEQGAWLGDEARGSYRLLLDVEEALSDAELLDIQAGLPAGAALAPSWTSSLSPGRRREEALPGSVVSAPLAMGLQAMSQGVHRLRRRFSRELLSIGHLACFPNDVQSLSGAGAALLVEKGVRRQLALAYAPRRQLPLASGVEAQVFAELSSALAAERLTREDGPALWKTLERRATAVLRAWVQRGALKGFRVRCDEETHTAEGPELWVELLAHQRVATMKLRMGAMERPPS